MRKEADSLGSVSLPEGVYYGVHSYRAQQNFPLSGSVMLPEMIESLVEIKKAAARANGIAGSLPQTHEQAIVLACNEILEGALRDQFIVDPIQGGAGTSANMNANEVIANRATEILGGKLGEYAVHPNDHVNMSQSTNDVFPSAGKLTVLKLLKGLTRAGQPRGAFYCKAEEFKDVVSWAGRCRIGSRTPGTEFAAYARALERSTERVRRAREMCVLAWARGDRYEYQRGPGVSG